MGSWYSKFLTQDRHSDRFNWLHLEASPYLKQHETNPVNWLPWCPEAFQKARREGRAVFLSVGYS